MHVAARLHEALVSIHSAVVLQVEVLNSRPGAGRASGLPPGEAPNIRAEKVILLSSFLPEKSPCCRCPRIRWRDRVCVGIQN